MTTTVYDVTTFPASVPATTGTRIVHSVPQTAVEAYTQDYVCVPMPRTRAVPRGPRRARRGAAPCGATPPPCAGSHSREAEQLRSLVARAAV